MPGSSSPLSTPRADPGRAGRWFLLGALIIGLLTLHFLSGHDSAGHHRVLAPTSLTTGAVPADPAAAATLVASTDAPTGDGHTVVAGCAMLLLTAAVVALAAAVRRHHDLRRPPATWSVLAGGLRGPPQSLCRKALCVERI